MSTRNKDLFFHLMFEGLTIEEDGGSGEKSFVLRERVHLEVRKEEMNLTFSRGGRI